MLRLFAMPVVNVVRITRGPCKVLQVLALISELLPELYVGLRRWVGEYSRLTSILS